MRAPRRRPCRSWLISTVENERFLEKQRTSDADAVILELEAGTLNKDSARLLAAKALREADYGGKYRVLRINSVADGEGLLDLEAALGARPDAVMLTKVAGADDVREACEAISRLEEAHGIPAGSTDLAVMIERANAVFEVRAIAKASDRVRALCFGPGDYTVDVRGVPTAGFDYPVMPGIEVLTARSLVVAGCRAAGVTPIDGPTLGSVRDAAALEAHARESRALGFDGMIVLSPRQVEVVNRCFTPSAEEVEHARHAIRSYEQAVAAGSGVTGTSDAEMVSSTIAERYRDVLRRAGLA